MYLAYIDDSGSTGTNLIDRNAPFQVIGGPVIVDGMYFGLEAFLSQEVEKVVPPDQWEEFEFHACDLFRGNPPFDKMGQPKCHELLKWALSLLKRFKVPIIYGAVDKAKLQTEIYRTADPLDMAFEMYLRSLRNFFLKPYFQSRAVESGMIVCDDSRKDTRKAIERAFRRNRKKGLHNLRFPDLRLFVVDDIYFGSSKNSIGIQLADICMFFVARQLACRPDPEGFYKLINDQTVWSQVFPADGTAEYATALKSQ